MKEPAHDRLALPALTPAVQAELSRLSAKLAQVRILIPEGLSVLSAYADALRQAGLSIERTLVGLNLATAAAQAAAIKAASEQISRSLGPILDLMREFQRRYKVALPVAVATLRRYKWFVTPSLPVDFIFEAYRLGSRRGNRRAELNRLFVHHMTADNCKNMCSMVNSWQTSKLLRRRLKIIRDCVSTVKFSLGRWNASNVVLPTLVAQIDGCMSELVADRGLRRKPKSISDWVDTNGRVWKREDWLGKRPPQDELDRLAQDILLEVLFRKTYPGVSTRDLFTFSRHKIMHGEQIAYGRIDNTIRALLVLDFLANVGI